eukprot:3364640-Rhodomonas_salina.2
MLPRAGSLPAQSGMGPAAARARALTLELELAPGPILAACQTCEVRVPGQSHVYRIRRPHNDSWRWRGCPGPASPDYALLRLLDEVVGLESGVILIVSLATRTAAVDGGGDWGSHAGEEECALGAGERGVREGPRGFNLRRVEKRSQNTAIKVLAH